MKKLFLLLVVCLISASTFAQSRTLEERRQEDRRREIEAFQKMRGVDADLSEIESMPRFVKAKPGQRAVEDEWIVEFMWDISPKTVDSEIVRVLKVYGGKQFSGTVKIDGACMFFIKTDENRARQIADDENVRRVSQNIVPRGDPSKNMINPVKPDKHEDLLFNIGLHRGKRFDLILGLLLGSY